MATPTGSLLQVNATADSGSSSISVPSDAEAVLVGVYGYGPSGNRTPATRLDGAVLTIGGQALTYLAGANNTPGDSDCVGMYGRATLPTGTQTFAWNWEGSSAWGEGAQVFIRFLKDVNTADPFGTASAAGSNTGASPRTASTSTLTISEGDFVGVVAGAWSPTLGSFTWGVNLVEQVDATFRGSREGWAEGSPTENQTASAIYTYGGGGTDGSTAVAAVVVKGIPAPANTVAPAATGDAVEGETLACGTGSWNPAATSLAYQWQRDDGGGYVNISDETANEYTLTGDDVDCMVRCRVTPTGVGGVGAPANSNEIGPIEAAESSGAVPVLAATTNLRGIDYRTGIAHQFQRGTFYAAGRDWLFYQNSDAIYYVTSDDGGETWGSPTLLRTIRNVDGWSSENLIAFCDFHFDGTYLHCLYAGESYYDSVDMIYRRGEPETDGTITWSAGEQVAFTGDASLLEVGICTDSDGVPWISWEYFNRGPFMSFDTLIFQDGSTVGLQETDGLGNHSCVVSEVPFALSCWYRWYSDWSETTNDGGLVMVGSEEFLNRAVLGVRIDEGADSVAVARVNLGTGLSVYEFEITAGPSGHGGNLADGQWHLLTAVFGADLDEFTNPYGDIKLYIDGVLVNSDTLPEQISTEIFDTTYIGAEYTGSILDWTRAATGIICHPMIWTTELTDGEVTDLYVEGPKDFSPVPARHWKLHSGTNDLTEANNGPDLYIAGFMNVSYEDHPDIPGESTVGFPTPYVSKATAADGTWATAAGFPYQLSEVESHWWTGIVRTNASGGMAALYWHDAETEGALDPYTTWVRFWDGDSWGSEYGIDDPYHSQSNTGVLTRFAYAGNKANGKVYVLWSDGGTSKLYCWDGDENGGTVDDSYGHRALTIAAGIDSSTNDLVVAYIDTSNDLYLVRRSAAGVWGSPTLIDSGLTHYGSVQISEIGERLILCYQKANTPTDDIYTLAIGEPPAGTAPTSTSQPELSGQSDPDVAAFPGQFYGSYVGDTIECDTGEWDGTEPITYSYQWYRGETIPPFFDDREEISGATENTYVPTETDRTHSTNVISCDVTATNAFGSATRKSRVIQVSSAAHPGIPVNVNPPVISGDEAVGETAHCSTGDWGNVIGVSPSATYTYQWYRDSEPISGATSADYTFQPEDEGETIDASVASTNVDGSSDEVFSTNQMIPGPASDTTPPIVNLTTPLTGKISDETGKDAFSYEFSVNEDIQAWKIKVVSSEEDTHDQGTLIEDGGAVSEGDPVSGSITYAELVSAGVGSEGVKRIAVFVQDLAGNWSSTT